MKVGVPVTEKELSTDEIEMTLLPALFGSLMNAVGNRTWKAG